VEYSSALQYNDYIVNKQSDIAKQMIQLVTETQTDLAKAEQTRTLMVTRIAQTIRDIERMPDWKGNTILRDKALSIFGFYRGLFADDYKRVIDMQKDGDVSPEEEAEYNKIMKNVESREDVLDRDFKTAQMDFASKNGFQVATTSEMQSKIDSIK